MILATTGRWHAAVVMVAAVMALTVRVAAGGDAPTVSLGIGGTHRTGEWTPVVVRLPKAVEGPIRIAVEDPDGQFVSSPPATISSDRTTAETSVRPGRPYVQVRVLSAEQGSDSVLATLDAPANQTASSTTPLMLVAGTIPAAASAARLVAGEGVPLHVVSLGATSNVGSFRPRDFDAFDAAMVCGTVVDDLDKATLEGLDGWVHRGGHLVFSAGASALTVANAGGLAARWLPGAEPRLVPLRRAGALEAFARSGGLTARIPVAGLMVPRFESASSVTGVIDVFEGASASELPLVVRRAHGFGTVTWIGIDLDDPWIANWPGCDRLLAAVLGGRNEVDTVVPSTGDTVRRVPDLAGQLRIALDTFAAEGGRPATQPVPFEVIVAVGILYCLALYPLDWWIVRRTGRPWLSWLTLPLLAGGFAIAAWGLGAAWGRDAPARARAIDMIDFDAATGLARGSAWAAVRSPTHGRLAVSVVPQARVEIRKSDTAVSWFADRGIRFGAIDAAMAHPSLAAADYTYGDSLADLEAVPIAAASSRLFETSWTGHSSEAIAESRLTRDARGLLTGRVTSRLPFPIERCWLLHGGWLYDVGRMEPGTPYDTEAGRGPRSLAAALTRRVAVGDRDRAERWDAKSTGIDRILEVAGLHAAAGGTSYTGLIPGRLGRLDLSPLLTVDRAVLIGIVEGEPFTAWTIRLQGGNATDTIVTDAAAQTLVRVVVPVQTTMPAEEVSP